MSKPKHICDLCSLSIPETDLCYIGVRQCKKNGVYTFFSNREAEELKQSLDKARDREEKLEKALDKACKMLEDSNYDCPLENFGYSSVKCEHKCNNNKNGECWKEWLLNES